MAEGAAPDLMDSARWLANRVMRRYDLPQCSWEDVFGNACEAVCSLRADFDPERANWNTYVGQFGRRRMADIWRAEHGRAPQSLPIPVEDVAWYITGEAAEDPALAEVDDRLALQEQSQRLAVALETIPDRERWVLRRHYFEHWTFRDIGAEMGVSESRAVQLHQAALRRLRVRMAAPPPRVETPAPPARPTGRRCTTDGCDLLAEVYRMTEPGGPRHRLCLPCAETYGLPQRVKGTERRIPAEVFDDLDALLDARRRLPDVLEELRQIAGAA